MDIVTSVKDSIIGFISLYKLELLTFAGIIYVIYWVVKNQRKLEAI